jgi:hypothetical protein
MNTIEDLLAFLEPAMDNLAEKAAEFVSSPHFMLAYVREGPQKAALLTASMTLSDYTKLLVEYLELDKQAFSKAEDEMMDGLLDRLDKEQARG